MPLPSSGAISLNQMHVEVGASSGTTCSLNDSDIRNLINKASGAQSSFSEFYGASASYNRTVTVGNTITLAQAISHFSFTDMLPRMVLVKGRKWADHQTTMLRHSLVQMAQELLKSVILPAKVQVPVNY